MKSLLVIILLSFTINAYACETHTYIIDGRMLVCTTCGTITTCT
jgi:hypothetical protein